MDATKENMVVKCNAEIFILSNSEQGTLLSYTTIDSEHFGLWIVTSVVVNPLCVSAGS